MKERTELQTWNMQRGNTLCRDGYWLIQSQFHCYKYSVQRAPTAFANLSPSLSGLLQPMGQTLCQALAQLSFHKPRPSPAGPGPVAPGCSSAEHPDIWPSLPPVGRTTDCFSFYLRVFFICKRYKEPWFSFESPALVN